MAKKLSEVQKTDERCTCVCKNADSGTIQTRLDGELRNEFGYSKYDYNRPRPSVGSIEIPGVPPIPATDVQIGTRQGVILKYGTK